MKTLLLLRHAKSSWSDGGLSDHDRPLNKRGLRIAPLMGEFLAERNQVPDHIISSTAVRARETAALIAEHSGFEGAIETTRMLYPPTIDRFVTALQDFGGTADTVMIVAHNPGTEEFVQLLAGHYERMPTCAAAVFRLAIADWAEMTVDCAAEFVDVWRPKEVLDGHAD